MYPFCVPISFHHVQEKLVAFILLNGVQVDPYSRFRVQDTLTVYNVSVPFFLFFRCNSWRFAQIKDSSES